MNWLMKPIYGVLAGALVALAILTFTFYQGRASLRPALTQARAEAKALKTNRDEWISAYNGLKSAREADQREAATSAANARNRCDGDIEAAKQSQRAVNRVLAKPVKLDAQNCPIRSKVTNDELTAILMANAR